ncbi:MAG: DUF4176 domain-containing protein [Oscillospiraceae bacterium]|jgi:hypothetical protein|nr:DUF4176 domain-containing protein [Oscillospiraceae bacterium]
MNDIAIGEKYLPIGSVVLLHNGEKHLMIYGRMQKQVSDGTMWDYIACLYPEGNLTEQYMFLFNHDQIKEVFHIGYQDNDEHEFQKILNEQNIQR